MIAELVGLLRARVDEVVAAAGRATLVPALVRLALLLAGLGTLAVGWPAELVFSRFVLVLLSLAAAAAVLPRGRAPAVLLVLAFLGWGYATLADGVPVTLPSLVELAVLGYLVHVLAALAAVLPYDALVAPAVLLRFLGRTALVLAGTVLAAVLGVLVTRVLTPAHLILASVLGLAVMAGLAGYLAGLLRRGPR